MNAVLAGSLGIATVVFAMMDNMAIFPSTLVGFFLVLTSWGVKGLEQTPSGKAARYAIISFSILVMAFNTIGSIVIPRLAATTDMTAYVTEQTTESGAHDSAELEDHFMAVLLNDAHELCFSITPLLVLNWVFLLVLNRKRKLSAGRLQMA